MIELLAFLSTDSVGINFFRRDLIKHNLPNNLKSLVKDVLAELESEFPFRNDLNKRNDIAKKLVTYQEILNYKGQAEANSNRSSTKQYENAGSKHPYKKEGSKYFSASQRTSAATRNTERATTTGKNGI